MPAYIDALIRKDMRWLSGLKKAFLAIAAAGALMAIGLPFLLTPQIVSFALPPEIRSVSFSI